jgi:hypothetical protein
MESIAGQKGLRHGSHKPMNPLAQNFGFWWFAGYTLLTTAVISGKKPVEP